VVKDPAFSIARRRAALIASACSARLRTITRLRELCAHAVTVAIKAHVIPKRCHGRIVSCAAHTSCGKPTIGDGIDDECLPF